RAPGVDCRRWRRSARRRPAAICWRGGGGGGGGGERGAPAPGGGGGRGQRGRERSRGGGGGADGAGGGLNAAPSRRRQAVFGVGDRPDAGGARRKQSFGLRGEPS